MNPRRPLWQMRLPSQRRCSCLGRTSKRIARKNRRGLLQFTRSEGRVTGMPVLGLLYPGVVLARNYDPVVLAARAGGGPDNATLDAVLRETTLRLEDELGSLTAKAKTTGPD